MATATGCRGDADSVLAPLLPADRPMPILSTLPTLTSICIMLHKWVMQLGRRPEDYEASRFLSLAKIDISARAGAHFPAFCARNRTYGNPCKSEPTQIMHALLRIPQIENHFDNAKIYNRLRTLLWNNNNVFSTGAVLLSAQPKPHRDVSALGASGARMYRRFKEQHRTNDTLTLTKCSPNCS